MEFDGSASDTLLQRSIELGGEGINNAWEMSIYSWQVNRIDLLECWVRYKELHIGGRGYCKQTRFLATGP